MNRISYSPINWPTGVSVPIPLTFLDTGIGRRNRITDGQYMQTHEVSSRDINEEQLSLTNLPTLVYAMLCCQELPSGE